MQHIGRRNGKSELQRELSWFLVAYLMMLLGVLLGVHLLQSSGHSVRSPQAIAEQGKFKASVR